MITAIIPARGNSKGIPGKNLEYIGDKHLLEYTLNAAIQSKLLDCVVVTTEDSDIEELSYTILNNQMKSFDVYRRPHELSQDHVQVDEVALFALRQIQFNWKNDLPDTIVILQPTSPFRDANHIDEAIEVYHLINDNKKAWEEKEIVFSAYEPGYTYEVGDTENARAWLFDPRFRLGRQQEQDVRYAVENGAIYVVSAKLFGRQRSFRHPNMRPYWMAKWESLEIDEPIDLYMARCLMGDFNAINS